MKKITFIALFVSGFMCLLAAGSNVAIATEYGSGKFGACQYETCSISLFSDGVVELPIIPNASDTCTIAKDTTIVKTGSSNGYTLQLSTTDSTNDLEGASANISATSGSITSPSALAAGTWGYRIDGLGGFGAGPTSEIENNTTPAQPFAAVPVATSADTIKETTTPADDDETAIWYGVCADTSIPAGSYTKTVRYTAVIN